MQDSEYNYQIEKTANLLTEDNISLDEQDIAKLEKYKNLVKKDCNVDDESAMKIVYESLLYLKLQNSESADPLQHGDQFGAGFS